MLLFFASQVGSKAFLFIIFFLGGGEWTYSICSSTSPDGIAKDHCKGNEWGNKQEEYYWSKLAFTRSVIKHVHPGTDNFSSHWVKMMIYFIYFYRQSHLSYCCFNKSLRQMEIWIIKSVHYIFLPYQCINVIH